ncbi:MAG: malate/lactate/ureidoglycolate dehydrogenase [Burkholderiaceae bacterium]
MTAALRTFALAPLRAAMIELVQGFGADAEETALVVDNLLEANLRGHDSHGIGMLPRYADAYLEGGLKPGARPVVRIDHGALVALDGQAGFGQVVGRDAMRLAIDRVRTHGSCIMALSNAHHLGRIGAWAEMAVAAGLVSVHFVNVISRPIVAPWGGGDGRFGTNPFAVGIPVPGGEPVVLDMATSVVAQGKVRVAHNKGEPLPAGQLLDHRGHPTVDPRYGVVEPLGALRTFGEHKGYGLALVCELLGGALAGALAVHGPAGGERRVLNGMLTIVFDPAQLSAGDTFGVEMRAFLDWVRASPSQPGFDRVRVAGEPERETRERRSVDGVPIDATTWEELLTAASKLGRDPATVDRLARG